jgi:hypothetical protein
MKENFAAKCCQGILYLLLCKQSAKKLPWDTLPYKAFADFKLQPLNKSNKTSGVPYDRMQPSESRKISPIETNFPAGLEIASPIQNHLVSVNQEHKDGSSLKRKCEEIYIAMVIVYIKKIRINSHNSQNCLK